MPFFILNTLCYMILVHDFVLSFSLFSTLQMIVCPWSPYVFRLQPRWTSSSSERAILEEVHSSDAATTSLTKYKPLIGVEHTEIKACHTQWQIFQNYGDYRRKMEFTYSSIVNTYFTHYYITYAICMVTAAVWYICTYSLRHSREFFHLGMCECLLSFLLWFKKFMEIDRWKLLFLHHLACG